MRELADLANLRKLAGTHTFLDDDSAHESYLELTLTALLDPDLTRGKAKSQFEIFGQQMIADHQDVWLLRFVHSPQSRRANQLLKNAIQFNLTGNSQQAAVSAKAAAALFSGVRNSAGTARSNFERLYALHRMGLAQQCESESASQQRALEVDGYRWLGIQTLIENSICASMANHFDAAAYSIETALSEAHTFRFGTLALRALGMQAAFDTAEGALRPSWSLNTQGLELFWKGYYPRERGFQFYSDLETAAEKDGMWNLAAALQREAIGMLDETDRQDFKAMAHFHLAAIYEIIGDTAFAEQEFDRSYALFKNLPEDSATRMYEAIPQIELAELEASHGSVAMARKRLLDIHIKDKARDNFLIRLTLERTLAAIERNLGNVSQEKAHLQQTVSIGNEGFRTLSSPAQRWQWRGEVEQAYRRLLDIEVSENSEPWQSFADWESYRLREMTGSTPFRGQAIENNEALDAAQKRAHTFVHSSLLSFAVFPERTVAWLVDNRGIQETVIQIPEQQLQMAVQNFYAHCSNANFPRQKVNEEGWRLYQLLLAPLEQHLEISRALFIESDGALSQLPWPALFTPKGRYLGEQLAIANATGLFENQERANEGHGRPSAMNLVANPGAVKIGMRAYAPLPDAETEADFVAHHSLGPVRLLSGQQANADALRRLLPQASSFHFAGHAVSYPAGGELLLHGKKSDVELSAPELAALDLSHLRLAVLSGCSTGVSEDPARDPYGLVYSFLFAGAKDVVASSWNIDSESTAQYMENFYLFLTRGDGTAEAARAARMTFKSSTEWQHPYYWAAFQVFGNPN